MQIAHYRNPHRVTRCRNFGLPQFTQFSSFEYVGIELPWKVEKILRFQIKNKSFWPLQTWCEQWEGRDALEIPISKHRKLESSKAQKYLLNWRKQDWIVREHLSACLFTDIFNFVKYLHNIKAHQVRTQIKYQNYICKMFSELWQRC